MYVCVCNGVTENDIRQAAADGVRSMSELRMATGCSGSCGRCAEMAKYILSETQTSERYLDNLAVLPIKSRISAV